MNPKQAVHLAFPPDRPLQVVLLSVGQRPHIVQAVEQLRPVIERHAVIVGIDLSGQEDMSQTGADVALVLGGDGSILRAAHQMRDRQLPVIAVNLGKLGFLADVAFDELPLILDDLRGGRMQVVEHLMFECQVLRSGVVIHRQQGLNEVAVRTGSPFSLMDIDLYVDSELVTTYSGDGLIISTPVGSTAYSLSAGGPILRKDLYAFLILPINPHTLTNRPVVDSADRVYEMEVAHPYPATSVVVDGRALCQVEAKDRIRVSRAAVPFKMATAPGHSYYRTLREKLGWSGQLRINGSKGSGYDAGHSANRSGDCRDSGLDSSRG